MKKIKILMFLFTTYFAQSLQAQTAVPTFNCMSLYWSPSGGGNDVLVTYRKVGDATWRQGLNIRYNPIAGTILEKGDYRGSVVNLTPGTSYEFKLDLQGTSTSTIITKSTWSENFPVGTTTNIGSRTTSYEITAGGTNSAYKVYDGQNNTINVSHNEQYCLRVSQSFVIVRNFILKGAGVGTGGGGGYIGGIIVEDGVHDVIIENCDISDFGRAHNNPVWPNQGYGRDAGIQMFGENIERIIVQRNKIHDPTYTTNCSFPDNNLTNYVHGDGPDGIHMYNTKGNHVFRFNEINGNALHMFNYCFEGLDNASYKGGSGADTDFYGNSLSHSWGNSLESEGGDENIRIWNNYMTVSSQHIGNAAVSIGPMYIWRNVFDESEWYFGRGGGSAVKMGFANAESWMGGRIYVFNNTVLQNGKGVEDGISANRITKYTSLRNNINQTKFSSNQSLATQTTDTSFDYDLYNGVIPNGTEPNGIFGVPTYVSGAGYNTLTKTGDFQLATNSLGYNQGVIINNFTDGYFGSAPDIGAHENGAANFIYGVNGTFTTLGTSSYNFINEITLYPNPTSDVLNASISGNYDNTSYTIYNTIGQVIESSKVNSQNDIKINTSKFNRGVYIIKFEKNNGFKTLQFIKN
jgi:Secretion system C-terminal sorting domain